MSIDGTDCIINEPSLFHSMWVLNKFKGPEHLQTNVLQNFQQGIPVLSHTYPPNAHTGNQELKYRQSQWIPFVTHRSRKSTVQIRTQGPLSSNQMETRFIRNQKAPPIKTHPIFSTPLPVVGLGLQTSCTVRSNVNNYDTVLVY